MATNLLSLTDTKQNFIRHNIVRDTSKKVCSLFIKVSKEFNAKADLLMTYFSHSRACKKWAKFQREFEEWLTHFASYTIKKFTKGNSVVFICIVTSWPTYILHFPRLSGFKISYLNIDLYKENYWWKWPEMHRPRKI